MLCFSVSIGKISLIGAFDWGSEETNFLLFLRWKLILLDFYLRTLDNAYILF